MKLASNVILQVPKSSLERQSNGKNLDAHFKYYRIDTEICHS
jgi:hypothetical protein